MGLPPPETHLPPFLRATKGDKTFPSIHDFGHPYLVTHFSPNPFLSSTGPIFLHSQRPSVFPELRGFPLFFFDKNSPPSPPPPTVPTVFTLPPFYLPHVLCPSPKEVVFPFAPICFKQFLALHFSPPLPPPIARTCCFRTKVSLARTHLFPSKFLPFHRDVVFSHPLFSHTKLKKGPPFSLGFWIFSFPPPPRLSSLHSSFSQAHVVSGLLRDTPPQVDSIYFPKLFSWGFAFKTDHPRFFFYQIFLCLSFVPTRS